MLFKRYTSLSNENSLIKTLNEKIDKLNIIDDNISTLKKEIFSEKPILQKHISDLYNSVEKINASMLNINNMLNSESSSNFRHTSLSNNNTSNKLENKIDFARYLKNHFINREKRESEEDSDRSNDIDIDSNNANNNSINELKILEKEIFIALKRLEDTESNPESNKNKK